MFLIKTLCYQLVKNSSFVNCNTLLVTPEKLVPPCGFGRYPSNQYFRHTEAQPHTSLTKRVLMLQFLLIQFYTVYEKYVIHYIMYVLIWNSGGKYTFCLATRVVCTQVQAELGPPRQEGWSMSSFSYICADKRIISPLYCLKSVSS